MMDLFWTAQLFRYGTEYKAVTGSVGWPMKRSLFSLAQYLDKLIIYD